MRSYRCTSFVLIVILLSQGIAQQPKNIVYRAKSKSFVMEAASRENATLKETLNWTFGGKAQRGWQLYEPLIAQFVNHETRAESEAFAIALSD